MKFFGKELSGKAARDLITRLVLIIVSGAVLVVSTVTTVAWFTRNTTVRGTGMSIIVKKESFNIIINRTTEYDDVKYTELSNVSGLKTKLGTEDYNLSAVKITDTGALAYELVNEDQDSTAFTRYLRPGSYGTLTFYIQTEASVSATFSLSLGGYANDYDGDTPIITKVENETYLDYLKGHILFFTGRTGADYEHYKYSGLINGSFTYNTEDHALEETTVGLEEHCYPVVLYWEWPLTYSDITNNISTTSPEVTKKYPVEMNDYISTYKVFDSTKSYFLAKNQNSLVLQELDDGYNDADQLIGDHIDYVVVYIE